MPQYSLLGHIAPSITSQTENLATLSLLYLLKNYQCVHEAFVELANSIRPELSEGLRFDTQAQMAASIPDLRGLDDFGKPQLLVEAKFWASLTKNQPVGYLRLLPEDNEGLVLFIAPHARSDTLWRRLIDRIRNSDLIMKDTADTSEKWRSVDTSRGQLSLTSWSFVLDTLEDACERRNDDRAKSEVWQLRGLCNRLDDAAFKSIGSGEDLSNSEQRRAQLESAVDILANRLRDDGIFSMKGFQRTRRPSYYRCYGRLCGHATWSIGYERPDQPGSDSPLVWLGGRMAVDERPKQLSTDESPNFRGNATHIYFALEIPPEVELDEVIESLYEQIYERLRFLDWI